MPRSAKEEAEEGAPAWILSYADLTQQLLCMFVLMFAMMKYDVTKAAVLRQAMETFGKGLPPAPIESENNALASTIFTEKIPELYTVGAKYPGPIEGMNLLVTRVHEGLKITTEGVSEFEEGSAELSDDFKAILDSMAEQFFRDYPNVIEIRGFTAANAEDSVNGDHSLLSYNRAKNAADYLINQKEKTKIDPKRIRVTACGNNDPLVFQLDLKQRHKNRRVEIIVSEELVRPSH
ncbi:MAG: OmpA family protein [Planctomycetes bacterium]|nr:OmpA family protein [Planctomycetota bacterium]